MFTRWPGHALWRLLLVMGGAWLLAILVRGYTVLLLSPTGALDLSQRWSESQVWITALGQVVGGQPVALPEHASMLSRGGYLPSSIVVGALLLWPDWQAARWVFGAVNLLCLFVLARLLRELFRSADSTRDWALVVGCLALPSIGATLAVGQYGIVVVACLALAVWLQQRGRWLASGSLLLLALIKPSLSLPYAWMFVRRRAWSSLFVAIIGTAITSAVFAWAVRASVVDSVSHVVSAHEASLPADTGAVGRIANSAGTSRIPLLIAGVGCVSGAFLTWCMRHRHPVETMGLIATIARLWTYHRSYDDVIMVFLLVGLLVCWTRSLAVRAHRGPAPHSTRIALTIALFAVGLSLWLPASTMPRSAWSAFQLVSWIGGAIVLLSSSDASVGDCTTSENPAIRSPFRPDERSGTSQG